MTPNSAVRKSSGLKTAGRTTAGLKTAVRAAARRSGLVDRAVAKATARRRQQQRLMAEAEKAAPRTRPDGFVASLVHGGDVERAAIEAVRAQLESGRTGRARTIAQVFQLQPGLRHVGDVGQALIALHDRIAAQAWTLFAAHDPSTGLRLAPAEYLRAGFAGDPAFATEVLDGVLRGDQTVVLGSFGWLDIARTAFVAGAYPQSGQALIRVERRLGGVRPPKRAEQLRTEVAWLRRWLERVDGVVEPVPAGEIPFAVIDYKSPDRARSSVNLGDPVQTLASLGHLVRRSGLRFTGDEDLVGLTGVLRDRVRPDRIVAGDDATLRLYAVDRDASSWSQIPDGTWTIAFGWFMHSVFGARLDLPLDPRLRPIFISFHVNNPTLLTPAAIEQLRRCAPVGCRDWNTVALLLAAGVPAFFSGCLTTTIDTLFPPDPAAQPDGTLYVDTPATGPGEVFEQEFDAVRERTLAANLHDALARIAGYRDTYAHVVASRLHCYLPARSIGADVEFRPKNPANVRFDGLAGITDAAYDAMRSAILDKLSGVLAVIARGADPDEVYATWRALCAEDVAVAQARHRDLAPIAAGRFDIAAACRTVTARSVVVERSAPGPDGSEIHVEFSGNLKRQLEVVLDSVVTHASRPVRAYLLCRDHDRDDHARLAALFPTVSFVWLPTDDVDYGPLIGLIGHITVATMDRLLLAELLPGVARIVHHDVDALCLADLAVLFDTDLGDAPLAARKSPHPGFASGFVEFVRASVRMPDPARAREFIARTHTRHDFDFDLFNAGIMVFDLHRMRAEHFARDFLPYVERFGLNDQAVLNAYAGTRYVRLEAGWNWHPRLELADAPDLKPKIAHWAGPLKPWGQDWVNGKDLWLAAEARLAARR